MLIDFHFFQSNYIFWITALIPLGILTFFWSVSARKKMRAFLGEAMHWHQTIPLPKAFDRKTILTLLAMVFFLFALARPRANPEYEDRESQALDIMVLLDISRSMAAEDIYPNRLQKAKRSISTLMNKLNGDRVGLVAFAGSAVLISPLTADYEIINNYLYGISTETIENQGTNIGAAIEVAIESFKRGSAEAIAKNDRSHILILFSDGEMTAGETASAVQNIKKQGIILYSILVGTEKGAPIPLRDGNGVLLTFKRDRGGNTVVTSADPKTLSGISESSGGKFYQSTIDDKEIEEIVSQIANLNRVNTKSIKARIYTEYFYVPLAIGLALLLWGYAPAVFQIRSALLLLIAITSFHPHLLLAQTPATNPTEAPTSPTIPAAPQNTQPPVPEESSLRKILESEDKRKSSEALKNFRAGKFSAATEIFKELQVDNSDSAELAYDTGTSLIKEGKVKEGRALLNDVYKLRSKSHTDELAKSMAAYNVAGSHAEEKDYEAALQRYASIVQDLLQKEQRSDAENAILKNSQKNLEFLTQKQQQEQQSPQQKQSQQDKDKKQEKQQEQGSDNPAKSQNSQSQNKEADEKDTKKNAENSPKQEDQKKQQNYNFKHRKKFKENEALSEQDAKRILEALKQQEQLLQKKFFQQKTGSRQAPNANDKDW